MITVSICEDEVQFQLELRKLLEEYCSVRKISLSIETFSGGEALLTGRKSDIILMDIRFPGRDGMEIIRRLREQGSESPVIFITAYPDYVFQAFDLDAVHYILKPATAERLFPALDKAVKRVSDCGKELLVTNGTSATRIRFREILYCEAWNHQITVHTEQGETRFFGTLDAVQEKLDDRFFRCHRSYLVNLDQVVEKQTGVAVMANGDRILIARRKQQAFTQKLLACCRKGLI